MKILVTGSTGFVGRELIERLSSEDIVCLGRSKSDLRSEKTYFQSDINSNADFSIALNGVDVVIHLAARVHAMRDSAVDPLGEYREVNTYGSVNLALQAIKAGVKRFIFISSIKVNGEETLTGKPFTSSDVNAPLDCYGQSKAEAEQQLLEIGETTGMEVVIIRPTLVYGPGAKANFASLMKLVSKGVPLPFGCLTTNKRSLVSLENLVDLIITCIDHPKAVNQTFLVSDDKDVSTSEIVRQMAISLGKPTWQLPVPVWFYKLLGRLFGKTDVVNRLVGSLQVDITHTKETLGWKPPQTLEEGFKEIAHSLLDLKK